MKSRCFVFFLFLLPLLSFSEYFPPSNPRLEKAYVALQAWKHAITSDPKNITANWCGPHVCNYTGVYCAPAPDNPHELTVAGVDINRGDLEGTLPEELGLLSDLSLFHLNSNRFRGGLPSSFKCLKLLFELDVSNNQLEGGFPTVVLELPALKYLDIRFNQFCGDVPPCVFDLKLDALFINNNQFTFSIPDNIGNSTVSVLVLANNQIPGCFPKSIANMRETLRELIILNAGLRACIPPEIGRLTKLRVLDVSYNHLVGPLPATIGDMKELEQLDVAHNKLSGEIPCVVCDLPKLKNFTYSYNFFCEEPPQCLKIRSHDDRKNCLPFRPDQRPPEQCMAFLSKPRYCDSNGCIAKPPPPPSSPPPSPPPPVHYHY
ncbi:leucine-rich repeat extensin-like protein 6 [Canna indica]|uniref:Cell wall hydroxyproline-rich glycoprotein n=1 Tax=Canna indica TaxID=4628 RepID=A0AAQ3QSB9_9LILI|nr:leucine-rich repeat extensin-like protein 6 [Canna indica]